nr:uncharacterized protein LOC117987172 [Maniola hyperantus]
MGSDLEKILHELRIKIRSDMNITLTNQEERITSKINENIDQKFILIQKEIETVKQTNENHEKRIALMEKQIRARNVIFFGIEEGEKSYEGLECKVLSTINNMGIKYDKNDLEMVRRMGKPTEGKIRPINITFTTYGKKIAILKNKSKLKNTNIYVKEDFPPHVLEVRKSLQEQVQKERSEGKMAYLKYDKIIIAGGGSSSKKVEGSRKNQQSKKRELESSPPQPDGNPSTSSESTTKHRTAKKK